MAHDEGREVAPCADVKCRYVLETTHRSQCRRARADTCLDVVGCREGIVGLGPLTQDQPTPI